LTPQEAGLLRTIDAFRDAEQHWMIIVPEDLLFLHARGFVTAFDDVLKRVLEDALAAHLPARVLPMCTQPPVAFDILVDREYGAIQELLKPGKRQRDVARGRIRSLLAMESHVAEDTQISEADINRVERAVRTGKAREEVFPRLAGLDAQISGEGPAITVRWTKKVGEGAPVRFIAADDPTEAAAVREVDLQRRFHMSATKLASRLELSRNQSYALRQKLGIDADPQCRHVFTFGRSKHPMFSDTALKRMREARTAVAAKEEAAAAQGTAETR
jgi:hypothetical protein